MGRANASSDNLKKTLKFYKKIIADLKTAYTKMQCTQRHTSQWNLWLLGVSGAEECYTPHPHISKQSSTFKTGPTCNTIVIDFNSLILFCSPWHVNFKGRVSHRFLLGRLQPLENSLLQTGKKLRPLWSNSCIRPKLNVFW